MQIVFTIIAFIIATVIPIAAFIFIYKRDFYQTSQMWVLLGSAIAGIIAFGISGQINRYLWWDGILLYDEVVRFSGPITEEILKGLIIWYLIRRPQFTFYFEGAIYGFAVGIGFAVFENYEYILNNPAAGLETAIARVISTNLMHATTTSILGISLGIARFQPRLLRVIGVGLAGWAISSIIHVGFNNVVNLIKNPIIVLVFATIIGMGGAAFISAVIRRGAKEGKNWINENLGMDDRVTKNEVAVVTRMDNVDDFLKPLVKQFGAKKAEEIKDFLLKQARMGLLRKAANQLADERMKRGTLDEIEKMRIEVDEARRKVGSYAMLFVRTAYPEDSSPLWDKLQTVIQARMAAPKPAGGINLWANLKTRQNEQKKTEIAPVASNTETQQEKEE